jgi:hypothetical protein
MEWLEWKFNRLPPEFRKHRIREVVRLTGNANGLAGKIMSRFKPDRGA